MLSFTRATDNDEFKISRDVTVHFNFAFNHVIEALNILDSLDLDDEDKINRCWDALIKEQDYTSNVSIRAKIIEEALQRIQDNRSYQRRSIVTPQGEVFVPPMTDKGDDGLPKYDFEQDAGAIYASFFMQYHIDLLAEIDKLSWFKFSTLFEHLSEKTPIKKIIAIRSDDLSGYIEDPERLTMINEQQDYYHLEIADEIERQRELEANGGELFGNL
ncbi:Gp15 family bacteriophage protein [Weissella viridescens]|uniref:Gp15 family bacteriophage protein n=1 Tax=Weissella viridescens TaxID=1629 RepID=UPI0027DE2852|nr:Gp15 family bacteriophage protein [uncultured Weissella sp.]